MIDQERPPNFRDENGELYLVRCFACDPEIGRENWMVVVATGTCAWCHWYEGCEDEDDS